MIRQKFDGLAVFIQADRFFDTDDFAFGLLFANAGALDQENEGRGAAVHNRHFRPVDFDYRIVDAAACERGHKMFNGGDGDAVFVADHGA